MPLSPPEVLRARYARYLDDPDNELSASARLVRALFSGDPITSQTAIDLGVDPALTSQITREMESAGYQVLRRSIPRPGRPPMVEFRLYSTTPADPPSRPPRPPNRRAAGDKAGDNRSRRETASQAAFEVVEVERAGVTHPNLGETLTVRGLVLDPGGDLVMYLSNGSTSWQVRVVGHVQSQPVE